MEQSPLKQPKISLEDYPYRQDVESRLLISQFTARDVRILEEIIYSSLHIALSELAESLEVTQDELLPHLVKLSKTGLFTFERESIQVDKERRKYFEIQIERFDPEFRPGLEFFHNQMRHIPIHVLPQWYAIPRTSSHIFDSIVERYLLTPQIFQRYLEELTVPEPALTALIQELYAKEPFRVELAPFAKKQELSDEALQELLLKLELLFVGCVRYVPQGEGFIAVCTPYQEWLDYVQHLKETEVPPLASPSKIRRRRPHDFSYIQDLETVLRAAKKSPLAMRPLDTETLPLEELPALVDKLCHLKLASIVDGRLYALESANDFLDLSLENRSLLLYRHPLNRSSFRALPASLLTDRLLREAEKSILRVLDKGWVSLEAFLPSLLVGLSEASVIALKRQGKQWKYTLPTYSEEELALIRVVVLEWLFELGITAVGQDTEGKPCFCVTSFGRSLFGS